MVKTRELTEFERIEIIRYSSEGYSQRDVASLVKCSQSTVKVTLRRYNEHQTVQNLHRTGRNPISNERDQRALINMTKKNRRSSCAQLALQWKLSNGKQASPSTVQKVLQKHDYMWRPACKKPRLTKKQKKTRLEFCNQLKNWTKYSYRNIIWSDEMNVEVDMRKKGIKLRRTNDEKYHPDCIVERTKQGSGSIGIWACMSYDGVKFFKLFKGRLNADAYQEILENYLIPSIDLMDDKEDVIFQQDNAPCHTAHKIRDFFEQNSITVMKWPPNSPDLNCIENLWSWLDNQLSKIQILNLDQLQFEITKILSNVPVEICNNLVDSMPTRIKECRDNMGGITRY